VCVEPILQRKMEHTFTILFIDSWKRVCVDLFWTLRLFRSGVAFHRDFVSIFLSFWIWNAFLFPPTEANGWIVSWLLDSPAFCRLLLPSCTSSSQRIITMPSVVVEVFKNLFVVGQWLSKTFTNAIGVVSRAQLLSANWVFQVYKD